MIAKNDGVIAQLVEQRTENPCVPGSIPGDTTPKKSISLQIKSLDVERSPGFLFLWYTPSPNECSVQRKLQQEDSDGLTLSIAAQPREASDAIDLVHRCPATGHLTRTKRLTFESKLSRQPFCSCDSDAIRTHDPQLRRLLLYPAELRNLHIEIHTLNFRLQR